MSAAAEPSLYRPRQARAERTRGYTSAHLELRHKLFEGMKRAATLRASQLFFWLLLAQWVLAVGLALALTPFTWFGSVRSLHVHVLTALFLGALINAAPLALLRLRPDAWFTRHVVAVAQMSWSALLIHITGGRIETHFHVFGSLAFVAFYYDWRVLRTAVLVVVADHLVRGFVWPDSMYGISNPEWWRFLEHAAWVVFECVVLLLSSARSIRAMRAVAEREADLAMLNSDIERQVEIRTSELARANDSLAHEMRTRLQMEAELRQSQKLESVGRLASGVAHEINTPVQFISDSVQFVREAVPDLLLVLDKLAAVQRSVVAGVPSLAAANEAGVAEEEVDLAYLTTNVPVALDRAIEGLGRVATIVRSMKAFAHPDSKEMSMADINATLATTLTIARNEYKYVAELETDLGELPLVRCHVGELNQVILNVVINAAHAIADVVGDSGELGLIRIRTWRDGDDVVISISDTGGGIPEAIAPRIFDPFFTTKEVGRGTGQGLAIARSVIVDKHRGQLTFETVLGKSTTFHIRLPIRGREPSVVTLAAAA